MMWGMKTKLMENGYWQDESHLSCNTDWGAFPTIGEHTYAVKANAENPDNFDFQADAIFPAQCDPYAGTQNDPSATLKPYQMHVSDFENNEAYLHIGMAQPAVAGENVEEFVFLVKTVNVQKVYPESVQIGNGSITEMQKKPGEKFILPHTFKPATGITETDVTWSSDNETVAKVDAKSGEIETLKEGEATITVTTVNQKTASIKIVVKEETIAPPPDNTDKEGDKGCGSAVFAGAGIGIAGLLALGAAAAMIRRKRG